MKLIMDVMYKDISIRSMFIFCNGPKATVFTEISHIVR